MINSQPMSHDAALLNVAIVGGGPSGIGIAAILKDLGCQNFTILERSAPGASFRMWPKETRLLTPSFTTNFYGPIDLNAIAAGTSVAYTLGVEHPSGSDYADYLQEVVRHFELPVQTSFDVARLVPESDGFTLYDTNGQTVRARYVVWATGEFQYPNQNGFPGAELCRHNSTVESYTGLPGDDYIVIGGYESGIDAAVHLSRNGKQVTVIGKTAFWDIYTTDPSVNLSPFTRERLDEEYEKGRIQLLGDSTVTRVESQDNQFRVHIEGRNEPLVCTQAPILATGFRSGLTLIREFFETRDDTAVPYLTDEDESTVTPGLFVVGPQVRHDSIIFCFIYKFRQRFGVVARALGERLGLDVSPVEQYRQEGLLLDDLSCCAQECTC